MTDKTVSVAPDASSPVSLRPAASDPAPGAGGSGGEVTTPPARTVSRSRATSAIDAPALLRQVAQQLDAGQYDVALTGLRRYVEAFPQHLTMRAHLAELHLRLGQIPEAMEHLEYYLTQAPLHGETAQHRVHCHTRLVELAVAQGNDYAEHLHRGGGLLALAEQIQRQDPDDPAAQRILFQAITELKQAVDRKPSEARPHFWLARCWDLLGQSQPAREHRAKARHLAPQSDLSEAELTVLFRE